MERKHKLGIRFGMRKVEINTIFKMIPKQFKNKILI